jgi:hypothetical protein
MARKQPAQICGYEVARKPAWNYWLSEGTGAYPKYPELNGHDYGGVDRMEWKDWNDAFYEKTLPQEFLPVWEKFQSNKLEFGYTLVNDLEIAKRVLEFSNLGGDHNEIIAIYADRFAEGRIPVFDAPRTSVHLGVDVFQSGFGSLIREGVFVRPDLFPDFVAKVNENGLFDDDGHTANEYMEKYKSIQEGQNIEQFIFDSPRSFVDNIQVYRIPVSGKS